MASGNKYSERGDARKNLNKFEIVTFIIQKKENQWCEIRDGNGYSRVEFSLYISYTCYFNDKKFRNSYYIYGFWVFI